MRTDESVRLWQSYPEEFYQRLQIYSELTSTVFGASSSETSFDFCERHVFNRIWAITTCRNSPNFMHREFWYITAESQSSHFFRLPLPDSLARYWIHLNGVWSSLCICAPGWFPRSALRSARRTRKEGCSVGSMFQMTPFFPKYCWVVHIKQTWWTVVAPTWLWLCFLFIAELHRNIKSQVWTLAYEIIRSNRKQLNLQLQFSINGLVTVECAWCAVLVFCAFVQRWLWRIKDGMKMSSYVSPFLCFSAKKNFFWTFFFMDMLYFSLLALGFC